MYYIKYFLIAILLSLVSACGLSVEEEIYNHLEKAVSLESQFEQQQEPIVELEKKEHEIYEKIISLSMSQFDEIKVLSKEATAIVDEREKRIEKEKESIDASKEEFQQVEKLVNKLNDENAKALALELIDIMNERYDSYDALYQYYKDALQLDRELYEMFQTEDLTLEQMEKQVNKINEMYDLVIQENKIFNERTDTYNKKKREFYQATELQVVFEEDEEETPTY